MKITNNSIYGTNRYDKPKKITFEGKLFTKPASIDTFTSGISNYFKNRKYNSRDFDMQYQINRLLRFNTVIQNEFITVEAIEKGYTKEGGDFMEAFFKDYYTPRKAKKLPEINSFNFLDMYRSTTPENVDIRIGLLKKLKKSPLQDKKGNDLVQSEIAQMAQLFDRIDKDKYTKSFILKSLQSHIPFESFTEINTLIEQYGSRKLDIFFDNFSTIMTRAEATERAEALEKGLLNPFYETRSMQNSDRYIESYKHRKENLVSRTFKRAQNLYNKYRYNHSTDIQYTPQVISYDKTGVIIQFPNARYLPPAKPESPIITSDTVDTSINIIPVVKSSPESRKFKVISDVKELINKTLRKSVANRQSEEYAKNATKMRLKLLPDIFESIKVTRKFDLQAGIKPLSSNSDSLTLYKLINGKNRKLVRYMLNKSNSEGDRIFEVREIIATIKSAEENTAKLKAQDKNFKAIDKKMYYETMYQDIINKYGKLPPKRKK